MHIIDQHVTQDNYKVIKVDLAHKLPYLDIIKNKPIKEDPVEDSLPFPIKLIKEKKFDEFIK